ncbi:MAG: hypothetical protein J5978_09615 [Spirochaetaceae bacterium]|nr:hypothetical protein [Spirochaetaceae bacterium]MBO5483568.1 hypothetical protein [Spirochaetaceae bacterium]
MFFSVKVPMKIGNRSFRTCICYKLDENLKSTVQKLASEGKAEIYTEVRFFCNGKLVEKTKNKAKAKKRETKQKVETNQETEELSFLEPVETPKEEDF